MIFVAKASLEALEWGFFLSIHCKSQCLGMPILLLESLMESRNIKLNAVDKLRLFSHAESGQLCKFLKASTLRGFPWHKPRLVQV